MDSSKHLIEQGPVNWVEPLAGWYAERNKQLDLSLKQWESHRKQKVKIAQEESLVKLINAVGKAGSSLAKGYASVKKAEAVNEVKKQQEFNSDFGNVYRGAGSTEAEKNLHTAIKKYEEEKGSILNNEKEWNALLEQHFPSSNKDFTELRQAYSKLSPATLLYAREYQGAKLVPLLNQRGYEAHLAKDPELQAKYANASQPDKQNMFKSWQLQELAPYEFSDGTLGSTIMAELNRASTTSRHLNKAVQNFAFTSDAATKFKAEIEAFSTTGGVDGEGRGNSSRAISHYIVAGSLDFEDDPEGTINGKTAMQKSTDRVVGWLSELAVTKNLDIPELLDGKISGHPGGNTLQQAFFNKDGAHFSQLMGAYNTGQKYRVAEFNAQRDGSLATALGSAIDGKLSEDQRQLALNAYVSAGGDTNNTVYKTLSGINLTAQTKEVAEAEVEHINNVLGSGRPDIFDDEINRLTNDNVKSQSQIISKDYKRLRKLNLDDENNSDGYADGLLNERNELNLAPGGEIPPRMQPARNLISQMRDKIWWEEYNIAKEAGNLNDNTIKDRVNARLTEKLTSLGFYAELNDPSKGPRGILTPNSEGEYPALVARKAALNELNTGSDKAFTVYELNNAWSLLGNKTNKNKTTLLSTKGAVLSNGELIALARNHWDPDTETFAGWPKDVLIKSEILGIPPSELVRGQLEALIASNHKEDQFIVESFKLNDLAKNIPDSDLKVLQFLQDVGDTNILAKYKKLGLQNFSTNQLYRLLSLEEGFQQKLGTERELTTGEADAVDTQERMDASKGTAASPELPANYGAQEDLQFKAAKWYREGKWDGLNKDQLIKLLKEEKLKLQTTE